MMVEYRPATKDDIPHLDIRCWPGADREMASRIDDQGTCSIIAEEDGMVVGQLYVRRYLSGYHANGIDDGSWWADFSAFGDLSLPEKTAALGCWHVGWRRENCVNVESPHSRGRGIGFGLLQAAVGWFERSDDFDALVVKGAREHDRDYLVWLGGLSASRIRDVGFVVAGTYIDPAIREAGRTRAARPTQDVGKFDVLTLLRHDH